MFYIVTLVKQPAMYTAFYSRCVPQITSNHQVQKSHLLNRNTKGFPKPNFSEFF